MEPESDKYKISNLGATGHKNEKARLNITVDKEALEHAKAQGINISSAIDHYLQIIAFPKIHDVIHTRVERINALSSFLESMQPLIQLLDIEIEIGEITDKDYSKKRGLKVDYYGSKIVIDSHMASFKKGGRYYEPPTISISSKIPELAEAAKKGIYIVNFQDIRYLYGPERILENVVTEMLRTVKNNQAKTQKLKLALKFLKALFNNDNNNKEGSSESGIETPAIRQTSRVETMLEKGPVGVAIAT